MATTMVHRSGVMPTSTVEEGAEAILHLAVGADMEGRSGLFFDGLKEARPDPQAFDPEARRRLDALSRALTGVG